MRCLNKYSKLNSSFSSSSLQYPRSLSFSSLLQTLTWPLLVVSFSLLVSSQLIFSFPSVLLFSPCFLNKPFYFLLSSLPKTMTAFFTASTSYKLAVFHLPFCTFFPCLFTSNFLTLPLSSKPIYSAPSLPRSLPVTAVP